MIRARSDSGGWATARRAAVLAVTIAAVAAQPVALSRHLVLSPASNSASTVWSASPRHRPIGVGKGLAPDAAPAPANAPTRKPSSMLVLDPYVPPPPETWIPTQAEVDAAVEAKTGATAPGLPNGGHNCGAENYGTSTGSTPPAEDFISPLRPPGSTLAFLAHPITDGLFVQYYACWPWNG